MPRIAVAGFQHETNSFATSIAGLAEFEMVDAWPPLLVGEDVVTGTAGLNLPISGAVAAALARDDVDLAPILWCAAEPSGPVTTQAFDTITDRILAGLREAGPLDGLYLDLHGAMVTDDHPDGEGVFLQKIRDAFGPDLPIAVSLDLHANLTDQMVSLATSISIFRTYPHLDMAETGARAFTRLMGHLDGTRPAAALRPWPFLVPLHAQFTGAEPAKGLYAQVTATDGAELAMGFTGSDMPQAGPALLVYGPDQATADKTADELLAICLASEDAFEPRPGPPSEVVREAMGYPPGKPVVIADVEDNAGGGGSSDTMGLLRALIDARAQNAMLALLHDPAAAATAHQAGLGGTIRCALGGRSGCRGDAPLDARFEVTALSDGTVPYEGEMYKGGTAQIGPTAVLRVLDTDADVQIVVSTSRNQCLDRGYFRHIGLIPETARILCVKSTVHFRADFDPIAQATLYTAVPGALSSDLTTVPYQRLRHAVRLGPMGPEHPVVNDADRRIRAASGDKH